MDDSSGATYGRNLQEVHKEGIYGRVQRWSTGVDATGEVQERCIREEYQRGEEGSSFSVWLQRGYLACGWDPCSMRACGAIAACMCVHQASSLQARSTELANEVVRHVLRPSSHPIY